MAETTRSISQIHDAAGPTDTSAEFAQLHEAMTAMFAKLAARFELERDPSTEELEHYGVPGAEPGTGPGGQIRAYVGPEVDWLIHSWMGVPESGFTNLHLTVWLGPQTNVPHFGMAWGNLPDYWYFVDYVPRVDLLTNYDYLQRYYGVHNEQYMELRHEPGFSPFVSQNLLIRQSVSNTAMCFVCEKTPRSAERMIELANGRLDDWLGFLDDAEPTPASERAALAERDLLVRRTIAEKDPANNMGVRMFGEEMTDRLVKALWGGNRSLPRPTGD